MTCHVKMDYEYVTDDLPCTIGYEYVTGKADLHNQGQRRSGHFGSLQSVSTNAGFTIYRIANGKIVEAWDRDDRLDTLERDFKRGRRR